VAGTDEGVSQVNVRAWIARNLQVLARLVALAFGRLVPVIPISRLLDLTALLGKTRPRADRPHVVVVGHDAFVKVLGDHDSFGVSDYARKMQVFGTFLLGREFTPEYRDEIGALRGAMPPGDLDRIRKLAAEEAGKQFGTPGHRLDVGRELARPVLTALVDKYFGVPATGTPLFDWCATISTYVFTPDVFLQPDARTLAADAGARMRDHIAKALDPCARGAAAAPDTVIFRLAHALGSHGLATDRVLDTVAGTIAGAVIPTFQEFVQVADVLLDLSPQRFRDVQTIARADREDLLLPSILEAARFSPRPPLVARECVRSADVGGMRVSPGTVVLAVAFTAGFDWKVAPRPWRFLAGRPSVAYPIFGYGQHHCVGATPERPIAQTVMTQMAIQLLKQPGLRRATGPLGRAGLNGDRLFVEWD
jgi:cytochrome P450